MLLVYLFSCAIFLGVTVSQMVDLSSYRDKFLFITNILLAYIMIEVGLEFIINKKKWKSYLKDYFVAFLAASLPWLFCFFYFFYIFPGKWEEQLIIARFAAPTATGILFAMLAAAGLAASWFFRKIEVLVVLDDVDTILLMVPLQFLFLGATYKLFLVVVVIILLIVAAWRYMHHFRFPIGKTWVFLYATFLATLCWGIKKAFKVEVEVLLPAFVLGAVLYNPHILRKLEFPHEHAYLEPVATVPMWIDRGIKMIFMFMVGLLLPRIEFGHFSIGMTIFHVLLITLLANLGKCAPMFFYRKEATLKERIALGVGMFPRGEVGAAILALALEHGAAGYVTSLAGLSLALNLLLTGIFISIVVRLLPPSEVGRS